MDAKRREWGTAEMSSALKQLCDADREMLNHKIRRDAESNLEIALWVEKRGVRLGKTEAAKIMAISRYAKSADFCRWLKRWENQDADLRRDIELQKQRFQFVSELTRGGNEDGLISVSRQLQARALTLATELSDEEFREAMTSKGFVRNLIRLTQQQAEVDRQTAAGELKKQLKAMLEAPKGKGSVSTEAVIDKVDEIMGLKHA